MSYRIAIVGGGGREDALTRKIFENGAELISIMPNENPSIKSISSETLIAQTSETEKIIDFIKDKNPDLVYVSPDGYLETNLVDKLLLTNIKIASPSSAAFKIESSKIFMRQLMKRYGIPGNLKFEVLNSEYDIQKLLSNTSKEYAIKPSGLTGGKGVKVTNHHFSNRREAIAYASEILQRDQRILIEEAVEGEEFSMQLFTDGSSVLFAPLAQDYKRLREGDQGPNTGGMGSITDKDMRLPFISSFTYEKAKEISRKFVNSLFNDGQIFKGVMYVQFMQTKEGPKVIEINGRLGDPEGMNILTLMEGDVVDLLFRIADADLKGAKVNFRKNATVLKYLVPPGYGVNPMPGNLRVNTHGLPEHIKIYYSGVTGDINNVNFTNSRGMAILAEGDTIEGASADVEMNLWRITGQYEMRHDIGKSETLKKKIEASKALGISY